MDGLLQNMKGFLGGYLSNEDKHNLSKKKLMCVSMLHSKKNEIDLIWFSVTLFKKVNFT